MVISNLNDKGVTEQNISNAEGMITLGMAGTNSTDLIGPKENVRLVPQSMRPKACWYHLSKQKRGNLDVARKE